MNSNIRIVQPAGWPRPRGYSNGMTGTGRHVMVSGMIGWDEQGVFRAKDLGGQVRQALLNIVAVLREAEAKPEHIVRMTWYVLDKKAYVAAYEEIGQAYRDIIGRHFPTMTAVQVAGLIEDDALVEIEVTALVP